MRDRHFRSHRLAPLASLVVITLLTAALGMPSRAAAQAVNTVQPPPSDFVGDGAHSRLELVREDDARAPTDLIVQTAEGAMACHLPCTVVVPTGMVALLATGLDQRFELELPSARFRVRAGEPVPWLESLGGIAAGLGLGAVGTYVALNTNKDDEVAGGIALVVLGGLLLVLSTALLIIGVVEQNGSAELDTFETALREGVIRF
ncbi:MAG: hypothetical protein K1X94_03980 [Sandaracinaceae bacterium]|nr:hypothetical protein [Sandaracinaceae bacterium]